MKFEYWNHRAGGLEESFEINMNLPIEQDEIKALIDMLNKCLEIEDIEIKAFDRHTGKPIENSRGGAEIISRGD